MTTREPGNPATRAPVLFAALLVLFAIAARAPIRSYDFFWHLATGRWIVEHRALPATDPFALASARHAWIDGEWLFQAIAYPLRDGIGVARAAFVGAIFAIAWWLAGRNAAALLLTAIAFVAAQQRLDARPSTCAAMFVVLAIGLVGWRDKRALPLYALLTIVWINTHPSALLAPLIAAIAAACHSERSEESRGITTSVPSRLGIPRVARDDTGGPRWGMAIASAVALLVNPYGWRGIAAPLSLTRLVTSGEFVNAEWLPSVPRAFPLLYLTIAIAATVFVTTRERQWWRIALFVLFAALAIRHVRNQGLYFAAFPLLVAPMLAVRRWMYAVAAVPLAWTLVRGEYATGVDANRFPVNAVARLKASGLRGNIYNPDQYGGYLIWSFYPERRTLTDGRNELHRDFIAEYGRARNDSRAWRALLRKYRIDLAVDEYRPKLEVVDFATKQKRMMPASLAYWPRREWALIGYDGAAMVFARRGAFAKSELEKWEVRGVVPDN